MSDREPVLQPEDIRYIVGELKRRINELAGLVRKSAGAAAMMADDLTERALSPGAQIGDVTSAAMAVRAVATASGRELDDADYRMLKRLGARIPDLDDGDLVSATNAFIACRVRL